MRRRSEDAAHLRTMILEAMKRDGSPKTVDQIVEMVDADLARVAYNLWVLTEEEGKLGRIEGERRDLYRVIPTEAG
jgi:hypothetical protein